MIAFERGNRQVASVLKGALALTSRVIVPASVLAQVWRGGPQSAALARIVNAGEIDFLDEGRAKEVGLRLSRRNGADIADSHVVCCAVEYRAMIATSDEHDMRDLANPDETLTVIAI